MLSNKLNLLNKLLNTRKVKAFRYIDDQKIKSLINFFVPKIIDDLKLIRIGNQNDGGYLVPDILDKIKYCFSAGVGHTNKFESDLYKLQIKSFLADFSVEKSTRDLEKFNFLKKYISSYDSEKTKNINSWITENINTQDLNSTILKLDVEGSEYEILSAIDENILKDLKIIIVEFHGLEMIGDENTNLIINSIKNKLLNYFYVAHIHPNNCCGIHNVSKFKIPSVLEVTYLNKKNMKISDKNCKIPNELDKKNVSKKKDITLPNYWFVNNS